MSFQPFGAAEKASAPAPAQDILKAARLTASRYIAYNKCYQKPNSETLLDLREEDNMVSHASVINIDILQGQTTDNFTDQSLEPTIDAIVPPAAPQITRENSIDNYSPSVAPHQQESEHPISVQSTLRIEESDDTKKNLRKEVEEEVKHKEEEQQRDVEEEDADIDIKNIPMESLVHTMKNEIDILNVFIETLMEQLKDKENKLVKSEQKYTDLKKEYDYLASKGEKENFNAMQRNCNANISVRFKSSPYQ